MIMIQNMYFQNMAAVINDHVWHFAFCCYSFLIFLLLYIHSGGYTNRIRKFEVEAHLKGQKLTGDD